EAGGQDVDDGGFAGARAAGDDDVAVAPDGQEEKLHGHGGDGLVAQQEVGRGGVAGEAADIDVGAGGGEVAEDDADARAIGQAAIEEGAFRGEGLADELGDVVGGGLDVGFGGEFG